MILKRYNQNLWGPLSSCPLCPLLNPALLNNTARLLIYVSDFVSLLLLFVCILLIRGIRARGVYSPQILVGMCRGNVKNGPGLRNELPVERENAGLRNELDPF